MLTMHYHRIDHVSLNVADRPSALAWYAEILGLPPASATAPADQPIFLGPAGSRLALFEQGSVGLRHVALAVDRAEQDRVVARLDALGVPYRPERASVYLTDPDGATLELVVARP
jgi:catechol 2,3-dioxygenase-like lactoylglutathione lyase family enzyme